MKINAPRFLTQSRAYKKALSLVSSTIGNPAKLQDLVQGAQQKFNRHREGKIKDVVDSLSAAFRLLKAYANGSYRDVSLESLGLIVASIIYFLMPLDALPDFILGLGLVDDAALLAWTLQTVKGDLDRFIGWEMDEPASDDEGTPPVIEIGHNENKESS